jgi:hypothetical protein
LAGAVFYGFLFLVPAPPARSFAASHYAAAGDLARARELLDETLAASHRGETVNSLFVASALVAMGQREEALAWLERAYRESTILLGLGVHPFFDSLHAEPRFRSLCARLRLPVPTPHEEAATGERSGSGTGPAGEGGPARRGH